LAICRTDDVGFLPEVKKGDWIVIDTSKRDLFSGIGAFRFGNQITVRTISLVEVKSDKPPRWEVAPRLPATSPLVLSSDDLGHYVDLLGEVVFVERPGLEHIFRKTAAT
jgi:hypothetical protein